MIAEPSAVPRRDAFLSVTGIVGLAAGAVLLLLLQIIPPTNEISPLRRTISEYALSSNKWIFDIAVGLVVLGSVSGFIALIRRGSLRLFSAAGFFSALWTIGLLVVIAYPKNNWAIGPSSSGTVHRLASVVAFVCLPIAVLLVAKALNSAPRFSVQARASRWLAIASLLWFGVILGAVVVAMIINKHWWELIPLGLIERLLALTEVVALGSLFIPLRVPQTQMIPATPELARAEA